VNDRKVIPFPSDERARPPSEAELQAYRRVTRNWSPALRQLLLPEFFRREQDIDEADSPQP
jgi:hypothetical protein